MHSSKEVMEKLLREKKMLRLMMAISAPVLLVSLSALEFDIPSSLNRLFHQADWVGVCVLSGSATMLGLSILQSWLLGKEIRRAEQSNFDGNQY